MIGVGACNLYSGEPLATLHRALNERCRERERSQLQLDRHIWPCIFSDQLLQ